MNAKTLRVQAYPALLAGTGRQPLAFRCDLAELAQEDAIPSHAYCSEPDRTGTAASNIPVAPPNFAVEPVVHDQSPSWPIACAGLAPASQQQKSLR